MGGTDVAMSDNVQFATFTIIRKKKTARGLRKNETPRSERRYCVSAI